MKNCRHQYYSIGKPSRDRVGSGKLARSEGITAVRNSVRDIINRHGKKIVLNLAGVTYVDSEGVGELVSAQTIAAGRGADIRILGLNLKARELLASTGLLPIFQVFEDEASALADWRPKPAISLR